MPASSSRRDVLKLMGVAGVVFSSGLAGAQITANGTGFKADEQVNVTFNGHDVGSPLPDSHTQQI